MLSRQRGLDPSHLNPSFKKYLELLKKWNKAYNLTSITNDKEIAIKHFEDSLAPIPFLPLGSRVLDIGTGGGFPGIPLKIERPDLEVILLDSIQKKIAFCEAVIRELKLEKISAICGRSENIKIIQQLGAFDIVISRATLSIASFLEAAKPFFQKKGRAILMKGPEWIKEEKFDETNWELEKIFDYELSKNFGKRTLLIFKIKNNSVPL